MQHCPPASQADARPTPLSDLHWRRWLLLLPCGLLAASATVLAVSVLSAAPHSLLDWSLLLPFSLVTAWEGFILWQLVLGFAVWTRGARGLSALERHALSVDLVPTGRSRTAVLIPIYEEDAAAVFTGVRVMLRSLSQMGGRGDVDVHVLSDTRSGAVLAQEQAEWASISSEWPDGLFYRHRAVNTGRKAGNIQDFFDRAGGSYDFAIVLDADSLMSGGAMRRLIRLMEEHPRVGLIQTVSFATGRETLFARIQQFAVRLYAPLALRGMHFWQGHEGSYWGHNAILRIAPFRAHCRLPVLPGKPPLGGEILCHDIVEGALLVGAGWEVHLLPQMEGTWEEMPTNALDLLSRERRWCQGNLQHLSVLPWKGLRAASRWHLATGILAYLML
ncbi:MAG: glucans biosynthesis glucosyltransferase MdoH, partial [Parafilimonas terrae]|nr:glucans biosynthesis glucosyltransferase MdoH [Parafilimonas terrae]